MPLTKRELLNHYLTKEPRTFFQYDAWDVGIGGPHPCGHPSGADEDGHSFSCQVTSELMEGSWVRVLVWPDAGPETAVTLLRKIADWIEDEGETICPTWRGPELRVIDLEGA